MTPEAPQARPESGESPERRLSERLRDCSHWVALLADQMEALEQDDFPKVRELEAMRARLAGEMREGAEGEPPFADWVGLQVREMEERVMEWAEQDRRARDEVSQLQDGSLPLVRGIRRVGSGHYLSLEPSSAKLDVRL